MLSKLSLIKNPSKKVPAFLIRRMSKILILNNKRQIHELIFTIRDESEGL